MTLRRCCHHSIPLTALWRNHLNFLVWSCDHACRVNAYLKGRFDMALVTAHTWSVTACQPSRKTSETFLQSWRYTRTWTGKNTLWFSPFSLFYSANMPERYVHNHNQSWLESRWTMKTLKINWPPQHPDTPSPLLIASSHLAHVYFENQSCWKE